MSNYFLEDGIVRKFSGPGSLGLNPSSTLKELRSLERKLAKMKEGLDLIEASLINLRPRDNSPIDRRFGELIKEIVQLKEK